MIDDDPSHAEALHGLGLLAHQAGRGKDALSWLSRAIELNPDDPAYHHNFGEVCLSVGRLDDAVVAFGRAVALLPGRAESHFAMGLACQRSGRPDTASRAFAEAVRLKPAYFDAQLALAVALVSAGRFKEAVEAGARAARLHPAHVEAHLTLGVAQARLGHYTDAEESLRRGIDLDPNHTRALQNLAAVRAARGHEGDAKALLLKATKINPLSPEAYRGLAALAQKHDGPLQAMPLFKQSVAAARALERRREMDAHAVPGDLSDAIAATEARLRLGPDMERIQFMLAVVDGVGAPPVVPAPNVTRHFDRYAQRFDHHLVDTLGYCGPRLLFDAIAPHVAPGAKLDVLDLGCGTGLVGEAFAPIKRLLYGVDLSPKMLEAARKRRVYDALEQAEVCQALEECQPTFDLVLAGDVFVYIGDLHRVFNAVVPVLRPGGLFAFTVESQPAGTYRLMPTGRFVHSEEYLRSLARACDLQVVSITPDVLRTEEGQGVACWVATFRARPTLGTVL